MKASSTLEAVHCQADRGLRGSEQLLMAAFTASKACSLYTFLGRHVYPNKPRPVEGNGAMVNDKSQGFRFGCGSGCASGDRVRRELNLGHSCEQVGSRFGLRSGSWQSSYGQCCLGSRLSWDLTPYLVDRWARSRDCGPASRAKPPLYVR